MIMNPGKSGTLPPRIITQNVLVNYDLGLEYTIDRSPVLKRTLATLRTRSLVFLGLLYKP